VFTFAALWTAAMRHTAFGTP